MHRRHPLSTAPSLLCASLALVLLTSGCSSSSSGSAGAIEDASGDLGSGIVNLDGARTVDGAAPIDTSDGGPDEDAVTDAGVEDTSVAPDTAEEPDTSAVPDAEPELDADPEPLLGHHVACGDRLRRGVAGQDRRAPARGPGRAHGLP